MLNGVRTWFRNHLQAATVSFNALFKKPIATLMTLVVIAITLTLPTLFWVFMDNVEHMTVDWKKGGHIALFLEASASPKEQASLLLKVRALSGVGEAVLKTPEDGLKILQKQEGMEDIMQHLSENPLPPVIEVTPELSVDSPAEIEQLYHKLKLLPQVEQAKVDMQWVSRLHAILQFATEAIHGLMALLALAVVLIIGNTLRLAIQNRHEEIQVLKLIGANDSFIIRPFLYAGVWYGFLGALLAILLVNVFMFSLATTIDTLAQAYQMTYPFTGMTLDQSLLIMLCAVILGWAGARLSVKRQLALIEPRY